MDFISRASSLAPRLLRRKTPEGTDGTRILRQMPFEEGNEEPLSSNHEKRQAYDSSQLQKLLTART
jgi:hypothetical protein